MFTWMIKNSAWDRNRPFIVNLLSLALGLVALPFWLAGFFLLAFIGAIFGLALKA